MTTAFRHPVWLVGFRPFFTLAFAAGALFPAAWALLLLGHFTLPESSLSPLQWHAHEMLYGFGWAVLGGFLLTASKNWVQIRGLHGAPLAVAVALWFVERAAVLLAAVLPAWLRFVLLNVFVLYVAGYVVWSLVRYRAQDTFKDNYFFIVALPAFLVAKNLLLDPDTFVSGWMMSVGLFRVAFAVMFERTLPPFMKGAAGVTLLRKRPLDFACKALVLLCVAEPFLPEPLAATLLLAAAAALLTRFILWKPLTGFRSFGTGVMYAGYLGLVVHLVLEASRLLKLYEGNGTLALHAFTFLTLGVVVPSMLVRLCQGHTGRKIRFAGTDRAAIFALGLGAVFRLVATQVWPDQYLVWIALAGAGWTVCFSLLGFRLAPFLFQPRLDAKEH